MRREIDESDAELLFSRSLDPMMIADDERRVVDANAAACLFLRLSQQQIRALTVDDLMVPELRAGLDLAWTRFLEGGSPAARRTVSRDLQMPDGARVAVGVSATPHFRPGRHLAIISFPASRALDERLEQARAPADPLLTRRECEILTLVALGNTGVQIAEQLFLSPATVATHVTNGLIKLGANNRAHGIAIAVQTGEIDPRRTSLHSA